MVLVDIDISAGNQDGVAEKTGTVTYQLAGTVFGRLPAKYTSSGALQIPFFGFEGITIPQGSTIDNASLNLQVFSNDGGTHTLTVHASDTNNPALPNTTTGGQKVVTAPKIVATVQATSLTQTSTFLLALDVQGMIQELVNNFDYNNERMLFSITSTSSGGTNYMVIYGDASTASSNNLTINYTAPSPKKDFTINALIQALGANGTCATTEEQAPILDNIDIWDTQHNTTTGSGTRVAHRWTPTVNEVAQLGTGITKITFWHGHTGGAGNFDTRVWSPASAGTTNETVIRSGGKFTFTGSSSSISKRTRTLFDATGSFVQKWLPTAGVEYVFGMIENFPGTPQTRKNATDTISGVRTGRSGGNWADSSPEDLAVELIIAVAGGQHSCFTIDAQLIVGIPAQPFCINAILTQPLVQICHEFFVDALIQALGENGICPVFQVLENWDGFSTGISDPVGEFSVSHLGSSYGTWHHEKFALGTMLPTPTTNVHETSSVSNVSSPNSYRVDWLIERTGGSNNALGVSNLVLDNVNKGNITASARIMGQDCRGGGSESTRGGMVGISIRYNLNAGAGGGSKTIGWRINSRGGSSSGTFNNTPNKDVTFRLSDNSSTNFSPDVIINQFTSDGVYASWSKDLKAQFDANFAEDYDTDVDDYDIFLSVSGHTSQLGSPANLNGGEGFFDDLLFVGGSEGDQVSCFSIDACLGITMAVTQVCLETPKPDVTVTVFPGRSRIGECIQIVLNENPPSLTGLEIVEKIVEKTTADPSFGFTGKVSRVKNWLTFLALLDIIEEDGSDPDWYETNWSLV